MTRLSAVRRSQREAKNNNNNNDDQEVYHHNHDTNRRSTTVDDEGITSNEIVDKVVALRRKLARRGHTSIKSHLDSSHSRLDQVKQLKSILEHNRDSKQQQ
jgi:hypothetical protein